MKRRVRGGPAQSLKEERREKGRVLGVSNRLDRRSHWMWSGLEVRKKKARTERKKRKESGLPVEV